MAGGGGQGGRRGLQSSIKWYSKKKDGGVSALRSQKP